MNFPKKDNNNNTDNNNNSKYPNLISSDLVEDSYSDYCIDNSFIIIESINKILYLIYSTESKSIISFDLINNKKINEIKNAHKDYISNFKYTFDKINKRDLIISISPNDRNIKLWNMKNWECLYNYIELYKDGYLRTACFLNFNDEIFIATSHFKQTTNKPIKIFDFKGNKIKEINDSKANTYLIESYFEEEKTNMYIITANRGHIKSYDYINNKTYNKYCDHDSERDHHSLIIYNKDGIIKLIDSCEDGNIRIWNFHSGVQLNKINFNNGCMYGICLWEDDLLFIACSNKTIILVDLTTGKTIKTYYEHKNAVLTVKIINHPKIGKCLLSQAWLKGSIIKWENSV